MFDPGAESECVFNSVSKSFLFHPKPFSLHLSPLLRCFFKGLLSNPYPPSHASFHPHCLMQRFQNTSNRPSHHPKPNPPPSLFPSGQRPYCTPSFIPAFLSPHFFPLPPSRTFSPPTKTKKLISSNSFSTFCHMNALGPFFPPSPLRLPVLLFFQHPKIVPLPPQAFSERRALSPPAKTTLFPPLFSQMTRTDTINPPPSPLHLATMPPPPEKTPGQVARGHRHRSFNYPHPPLTFKLQH